MNLLPLLPRFPPVELLVRIRMTDAMLADSLYDASVVPPVRRPASHVVVTGIVNRTGSPGTHFWLVDVGERLPQALLY